MREITDEDLKLEIVDLLISIYDLAEHVATPEQLKSFLLSASEIEQNKRKRNLRAASSR